ncbi:hypothetical protein DFJ58DRAFT_734351 [Suillus subalutaceus]|uniref:uncharacterized protein n=1 Tax=Suillus subalutaceus TaxID=48586 RepID=UPI001B87BE03|nr:uncharacterized protein DFJ58DRAFT_734351 [Suillus subalutaceus]KAG1837459.1 hypothetical protein DFJ58DRAFT_734351 [Suillus subalutaceus]
MPHTKQTGRTEKHGTVLHPHVKPVYKRHRAMTAAKSAAKSAAKHTAISGALPQPIHDFRIPVTKAELSIDQWEACAPHRIHYGVPKLVNYVGRDNTNLEFLRVPAMKDRRILGHVLLPTRYCSSWVYLCYCVEYWLSIWKCWDEESKKKQKKTKKTKIKAQQERAGLIDTSRKNAGARFLQAMVARRIVLEECIANGVNDGRIKSLDEFLIRDRRDWLFVEFDELPDDADMYLAADPLHTRNKRMFETGWGVNVNDIPMMLGGADNAWMSKGLDLSEMFKKDMDAAIKHLKKGGKGIDIPYDENAALPDRWHEYHEPPIRFISERKDQFLRDGFTLDAPLVFLYHCLRAEEEIERRDFLREIMDMLPNDGTRQQWSLRVDQLIDGEMAWDEFSNLVADALDLELDRRTNNMGPDSVEPDLPFLKLDARIAVRAYLRNSKSNPDTAADIFFRSISRFSDPDTKDRKIWDWVMTKAKPDTVTTVLQKAHDHRSKSLSESQGDEQYVAPPEMKACSGMGTDSHEESGDGSSEVRFTLPEPSPVPSSVAQQPPPAMAVSRREAWLCSGHTLDKPLVFLRHYLEEEDHIKQADFLQEIMDFLPMNRGRDQWSERVDHLYQGLTTWSQFSQLLADDLDLHDGQLDGGTDQEGENLQCPFRTLDAKIAIRTYLRHLKEKPHDADKLFCACVDRFSIIPSSEPIWRSVQKLSLESSLADVLKFAEDAWYGRPPDHTPDTIMGSQDEIYTNPNSSSDRISQFTAASEEGG